VGLSGLNGFVSHRTVVNSSVVISSVASRPCLRSLTRSCLISKPMTGYFLANSTAKGRPT